MCYRYRSAISTVSPTSVCKLKNMCNYPFAILFCQALTANSVTRMHSSRMCKARLLTLARSICRRQACVPWGQACLGTCVPGGGMHAMHAPLVNRMTDACENISLPQTSFEGWYPWGIQQLVSTHQLPPHKPGGGGILPNFSQPKTQSAKSWPNVHFPGGGGNGGGVFCPTFSQPKTTDVETN